MIIRRLSRTDPHNGPVALRPQQHQHRHRTCRPRMQSLHRLSPRPQKAQATGTHQSSPLSSFDMFFRSFSVPCSPWCSPSPGQKSLVKLGTIIGRHAFLRPVVAALTRPLIGMFQLIASVMLKTDNARTEWRTNLQNAFNDRRTRILDVPHMSLTSFFSQSATPTRKPADGSSSSVSKTARHVRLHRLFLVVHVIDCTDSG